MSINWNDVYKFINILSTYSLLFSLTDVHKLLPFFSALQLLRRGSSKPSMWCTHRPVCVQRGLRGWSLWPVQLRVLWVPSVQLVPLFPARHQPPQLWQQRSMPVWWAWTVPMQGEAWLVFLCYNQWTILVWYLSVFSVIKPSFSLLQANVVGRRCGKCISGTFGLSVDNPSGCTSCYCFQRTTQCTQADLTWSQVRQALRRGA